MFSYQPITFWDSIKPLIYYQRFIGLGIFQQPNQTRWLYHLMCFWVVAINLLIFPTTSYNYLSLLEDMNLDSWERIDVKATTLRALTMTNFLHSLIAPFLIWSQRKVVWNRFKDLQVLDDEFQAIFGAQIHSEYRRRFFTLSFQITSSAVLLCLVTAYPRKWPTTFLEIMEEMFILITLIRPLCAIVALNLNHWIFLRYIEKKFIDLNDGMLRLAKKSSPYNLAKKIRPLDVSGNVFIVRPKYNDDKSKTEKLINFLRELRKLHFKLCKLSRKMNSGFGVQNLITAGTSFLIVTGLSYELSEFYTNSGNNNEAFGVIFMLCFTITVHGLRICLISHSCWSVTKEADKTREIVYELLKINDINLRKEIRDFSVQMLQNPVSFDACGFFKLDHYFIQRMIATITTYLIILIQMSNPPKNKCGLLNNITKV